LLQKFERIIFPVVLFTGKGAKYQIKQSNKTTYNNINNNNNDEIVRRNTFGRFSSV